MTSPSIAGPFFRSKAGRSFLLLVAASAALAMLIGAGFHRSNLRWFEANKGEETVTAVQLVDAFVATYSDIRGAHMTSEATVPATYRAHAIDRFNRDRDSATSMRLVMVGPPGRHIETPPLDEEMAETIRGFSRTPNPKPETSFVTVNGTVLLRTIYPSVATQQSCVDCHNTIHAGRHEWKLNDVVGAFAVDVPAGAFLQENIAEAIEIALAVFLACVLVSFYVSVLQYRHQRADEKVIEALKGREREMESARNAAEVANRTKSQFLANMSHELRTPLNAIIGFSEIISKDMLAMGSPSVYKEYAQDINSSGQNLLQIINDILDMSKIDAGKLELREDQFEIGPAVLHCIRMIGGRAHEAGVLIANDLPAELPPLYADQVRFKQILLNLMSNAVKFTPRQGSVRLSSQQHMDGSLSLVIADTGIGMSPDEIAIAMQPFRQIDSDLARKHEGTGLGLPLTKALIELHGGTLTMRSEKGRGTEVTVTLPPRRVVRPDTSAAAA